MGSEWPVFELSELSKEITVGFVGSMTHEYVSKGIPFLRSKNIAEHSLNWNDIRYISSEFHTKLKKSELKPGDVAVVRTGKPGTTCVIPESLSVANCSDLVIVRVDQDRLDPHFLSYFMNSVAAGQQINSHVVGAVQQHFNVGSAKKIKISAPSIKEQKRVVGVLINIDNKIQLNRQTNQTLEAMAQALFKSWFVDFDPVFDNAIAHNLAHNNAPLHNIPEPLLPHAQRRLNVHNVGRGLARQTASQEFHHLFPQAFEQSDEPSVGIQGWVPKGWGVEKIGDVIENVGGGTPKTKEDDYWINGTHAFCTPKDMSSLSTKVLLKTERHLTDLGVSKVSSGVLDVGTVLMSSRAPIGYLAIAKTPTTVNQGIIAMKPNEKYSSEYILCWAEINQEEVVARANGSTFLEISKKNFREIPFVEPTDECTKQFGILAKEYFDRIEILSKENKQLESLRDTLLPKLISGELRIPDAEQVSEALAK